MVRHSPRDPNRVGGPIRIETANDGLRGRGTPKTSGHWLKVLVKVFSLLAFVIGSLGLSGQPERSELVPASSVGDGVNDWVRRFGSRLLPTRSMFPPPDAAVVRAAGVPPAAEPGSPPPAPPAPPPPPKEADAAAPPPPTAPVPPPPTVPPIEVPEWKKRCEAIVGRVLAQVRPPTDWRIECAAPNNEFDGMAFFDRHIEVYVDESDTDHHIEMVVAHEIGHAWQHEAGLPWGPDGYEWWAELRGLPSNVEPNEDWADVFACYVGWCGRYAVQRSPSPNQFGVLEGSLDAVRDLWSLLNG